jgi:hexosaminidase
MFSRTRFYNIFFSVIALLSATALLAQEIKTIPFPKSCAMGGEKMVLNSDCRIVADDVSLLPLAKVAGEDLALLFGAKSHVAQGDAEKGGIELKIDQQLKGEAYKIEVSDRAVITGGSTKGVAWGMITLLQAADADHGKVIIPRLKITDQPYASYRGLMVDLARQWHPIDAVKQAVVLCQ